MNTNDYEIRMENLAGAMSELKKTDRYEHLISRCEIVSSVIKNKTVYDTYEKVSNYIKLDEDDDYKKYSEYKSFKKSYMW